MKLIQNDFSKFQDELRLKSTRLVSAIIAEIKREGFKFTIHDMNIDYKADKNTIRLNDDFYISIVYSTNKTLNQLSITEQLEEIH